MIRWLAALGIAVVLLGGGVARADVFHFGCAKLPFPVATQSRAIDRLCGVKGDQTIGQKALQNTLKNELCRDDVITTLQLNDFLALQNAVSARGIRFGYAGFPPNRQQFFPDDRAALANLITVNGRALGEGSRVQLVAFMDDPHYADTSAGESVNCMQRGNQMNDIHINLVERPAPKAPAPNDPNHDLLLAERHRVLCHVVVAEIIPHYRPATWEEPRLQAIADQRIPVRIAGQLFFDASHFPCDGEAAHPGESLRRASLWEIHPVYSIDVCRFGTLQACRAEDASTWLPLADWQLAAPRRRR